MDIFNKNLFKPSCPARPLDSNYIHRPFCFCLFCFVRAVGDVALSCVVIYCYFICTATLGSVKGAIMILIIIDDGVQLAAICSV